jgi:hypothetical protein
MLDLRPRLAGEIVLVLLVLAGGPATAQTSSATAFRATPAAVLKQALRSTVAAQARFHAEQRRYAASAEQLKLRLEPGVGVEVLSAGKAGWQARAVHRDQPGKSCVIFVGRVDGLEAPRTDGDREMAGEDGVPLCDRMR